MRLRNAHYAIALPRITYTHSAHPVIALRASRTRITAHPVIALRASPIRITQSHYPIALPVRVDTVMRQLNEHVMTKLCTILMLSILVLMGQIWYQIEANDLPEPTAAISTPH